MSITLSMMEIVKGHMMKNGVTRLKRIKIRVGELTAVEPQSLLFCFEVCTKDTLMEGATLDIEDVPLKGRCMDCDKEFQMKGFFSTCPVCSSLSIKAISGHELDIVSMEVE